MVSSSCDFEYFLMNRTYRAWYWAPDLQHRFANISKSFTKDVVVFTKSLCGFSCGAANRMHGRMRARVRTAYEVFWAASFLPRCVTYFFFNIPCFCNLLCRYSKFLCIQLIVFSNSEFSFFSSLTSFWSFKMSESCSLTNKSCVFTLSFNCVITNLGAMLTMSRKKVKASIRVLPQIRRGRRGGRGRGSKGKVKAAATEDWQVKQAAQYPASNPEGATVLRVVKVPEVPDKPDFLLASRYYSFLLFILADLLHVLPVEMKQKLRVSLQDLMVAHDYLETLKLIIKFHFHYTAKLSRAQLRRAHKCYRRDCLVWGLDFEGNRCLVNTGKKNGMTGIFEINKMQAA